MKYFMENYKIAEYNVIGIDGYEQKTGYIYPWEIWEINNHSYKCKNWKLRQKGLASAYVSEK
jgi:hypothetical protein